MITIENTVNGKSNYINNVSPEKVEDNLILNSIEIDKPLNEVKKIRNYIDVIFERLEDKGLFKFYYDHSKKTNKTFKPSMNILFSMPFPMGILQFKKKPLSLKKLSEILFKRGFNIIEVKQIGKYYYYVAHKDLLLTI